MDWIEKIKNFPQLIQNEPRYGYLVVAAILLIWLIGVIFGWRWTYSRPGSTGGGNALMNLIGPRTFRFWLGIFITILIATAIYLFVVTDKP